MLIMMCLYAFVSTSHNNIVRTGVERESGAAAGEWRRRRRGETASRKSPRPRAGRNPSPARACSCDSESGVPVLVIQFNRRRVGDTRLQGNPLGLGPGLGYIHDPARKGSASCMRRDPDRN